VNIVTFGATLAGFVFVGEVLLFASDFIGALVFATGVAAGWFDVFSQAVMVKTDVISNKMKL
jgi:site-specific recombinase